MMTNQAAAEFVLNTLHEHGFEAFVVGGCVRDLILHREPKDFDVTTNARPEQVTPLFEKTIPVGAAFGVVVVVVDGVQIEVATFRADGQYSDGRRPDSVSYSESAEEDVIRRDFTINGLLVAEMLAFICTDHSMGVIDHVGGVEDIKAKVIRCIGDPNQRFAEDALRMLRAVRFAAQLGFEIEQETFRAIVMNAASIKQVSRERVAAELFKLVSAPFAERGLSLLASTGLLRRVLPNFETDFPSTLQRFAMYPTNDPILGMAMLLADARPGHHEEMAIGVCNSLKLSNGDRAQIVNAVKYQFNIRWALTLAQKKRLAREAGIKYAVTLLEQDAGWPGHDGMGVEAMMARIAEFDGFTPADIFPQPLVTGYDLIEMGLKPSPDFTRILTEIETRQLDEELSDRETALAVAQGLALRLQENA